MNATATIAPAGIPPAPSVEPPSAPATEPSSARSAEPQHMRALERANQVRLARAELKRRVAAGELDVCEVILECPWEADSMAVGDLLMSQRRWGQTRCRKFLSQIPMSEQKTIGSMTERQRRTLAALLSTGPSVAMARPWLSVPQLAAANVTSARLTRTSPGRTARLADARVDAASLAPTALARGGR